MKENGIFAPDAVDISGIGLRSSRRLNLPDISRYLPKRFAKSIAPIAMAASAAVYGGAACSDGAPKASDFQKNLGYSLTLPFAQDETWWYTGGPHSDGSSDGVRYAIDLAPVYEPRPCPGNSPYRVNPVRAIADGVVSIVGNQDDPRDKEHSIVEVEHKRDFTSGYMHLDDIPVETGQEVDQGDILGYVSCEFPPGGGTEGEHLHLYGEVNGKPIEIDRMVMSGWTIEKLDDNYDGIMYQSPSDVRTADRWRCGPSTKSIQACGGIRNDIRWNERDTLIMPTIAPVPTLAAVPTPEPAEVHTVEADRGGEVPGEGGKVSVLGWEFRIKSWGDEPDYEYGSPSTLREGWRRVVVGGDLVNPSNSARSTAELIQYFNDTKAYRFKIKGGGNSYDAEVGKRPGLYRGRWVATDWLDKVDVPGGVSMPFLIIADVPNTVVDYELGLYDARSGSDLAASVHKGETYSGGGGSSSGGEGATKLKVCEVSGYASIKYAGDTLFNAVTIANGRFQEQYLMFDITNKGGRDLSTNYGWGGINASVFTRSQGVREGSEHYHSEEFDNPEKIAPGLEKRVYVPVGTDGGDEIVDNKLVNMNGAVVSLTIWDANRVERNCSWNLP